MLSRRPSRTAGRLSRERLRVPTRGGVGDRCARDAWRVRACPMSFDRFQLLQTQGAAHGLHRTVDRLLRSVRRRLAAWRIIRRPAARPDAVVIGTLRRPRLAITMRAAVVRAETTPPPLAVFLDRLLADPPSPYCPRCSLPLEPWDGDAVAAGPPIGYECRPCGTRIRWTPADVVKQVKREVRRHYARYWAQYRAAIREYEREGSSASVSGHHGRGGAR
jgi:hypothetical protein